MSTLTGVVLGRAGGRYRVYVDGKVREASLRGRLKLGTQHVLVGDTVRLGVHDDALTIEGVEPRRSLLKRRTPGTLRGQRPVAANLDQVVVVGAVDRPPWDPRLMDRFTAVAAANHLPVVLVVNKCDLGDGEACAAPYRPAGYAVVLSSVPDGRGLGELRAQLEGRVSLFTGPTGVGKSSLLNALVPGLRLRTAPVSRKSRAGRHTTVTAEMHPIGRNGFVVDTPGLRDIGLWGLEPADVEAAFPEIAALGTGCRFDNCRHLEEPGCAAVAAMERGAIAASRLDSYRRMLAEALEAARPWAAKRPGRT